MGGILVYIYPQNQAKQTFYGMVIYFVPPKTNFWLCPSPLETSFWAKFCNCCALSRDLLKGHTRENSPAFVLGCPFSIFCVYYTNIIIMAQCCIFIVYYDHGLLLLVILCVCVCCNGYLHILVLRCIFHC